MDNDKNEHRHKRLRVVVPLWNIFIFNILVFNSLERKWTQRDPNFHYRIDININI